MTDRLENARTQVEQALHELEVLFSKECKLTFVMRHPTMEECYMVITRDDPMAVAAVLHRAADA